MSFVVDRLSTPDAVIERAAIDPRTLKVASLSFDLPQRTDDAWQAASQALSPLDSITLLEAMADRYGLSQGQMMQSVAIACNLLRWAQSEVDASV
jgi:hypothetical protein